MAVICFRHEFFSTASILFVSILLVIFQGSFRAEGRKLVSEEVATLKVIASKLGIKDWNFSVDPCSENSIWIRGTDYGHQKNVTCDCSFMNGTICHISSIALKSQNLTGLLPVELKNFAFLKSLDLALNYISGTLPASWASLPLVELSLFENRIFGRIPKEIGNITTLETLVLDGNKFEGTLPPELGNLTGLNRLSLISNNFTGELPSTFVKFTNMSDFRITGSDIRGRVPEFIGNWTKLQNL